MGSFWTKRRSTFLEHTLYIHANGDTVHMTLWQNASFKIVSPKQR